MLSVFFIGDEDEQANCFVGKCDIVGIEALNKKQLPTLQAIFVELDQLVEAADAEVLHVVVAVIEELVDVCG